MNSKCGQLLPKTFIHLSIILFLTISCKKKQEDSAVQIDDKPTILNSLSQEDSRINNIDMPEIGEWKPNALNIQFMGSETVDGPLHFAFSLPMVHEDSLDDGSIPNIVFEPEIKGSFSWKSPTNLLFQPNEGELNHGQYFTIYIDTARPLQGDAYALQEPWIEEYHVPFFTMAGKVASWRVSKGNPQFISILNWRSGEIGNGPIYLLYDQPIKIENVRKNIDIQDEEENALQYTIFRPEDIDMVYDGEVNLEHIIGVQVQDLPVNHEIEESPGVIINVPSWYDDGSIDKEHRFLTVRTDFNMKNAYVNYQWNNYEYVPLYSSWNLSFSNWVSLGQIKKHVRINPKPKSIHYSSSSDYDYSDEKYISVSTLSMEFEPGTTYTLSMDENLTDVLGNKLPQEFDTVFTTVDLSPILELPREAILIEKEVTKIPVRTQNLSQVEAKIFPFKSEQQFAKALLMGDRNDLSDYGLYGNGENVNVDDKNSSPNNIELLDINLNRQGGLYGVVVNAVGTGSEGGDILSDVVLVQSSNLGITSKVYEDGIFTWVTSLNDAKPVGNKSVKLFDGNKIIAETTTDQNGVAVFNTSKILQRGTLHKTLIIIAGKGKNASVAKIDRKELSNAWQFGLHGKVRSYNPLHAVVFTERGVYRPGEMVHIKAILSEQAGKSAMAKIKVNDPRGQQVLNKTKELDDFNSTSIDFKLKDQAAVGEYSVHVSVSGGAYTTRTFKVEEYRVPTFQVKVKNDDKKWEINKTVKATIEAKYLHGGTLDGREIRWMVSRTPIPFTAKDFPQYIFSWNQGMNYEGVVTSGNKRLDGKGKLNVRFNPDHPPLAGAMQYTLEGTVTDVDRQAYAGRTSKVIHPADFYIGLKPPSRSILSTGEKLKVPVIALDVNNRVVNGTKVKVLLERIDYHTAARLSSGGNVQMLNRPETVRINYYEIKTKPTASILEFDLKEAGRYRVNAWTEDKNKKLVQSGFEFTVSGNNTTAWPRFDQERIDLIADKESYEAGETAKIVTQTPYETATGIITIERDSIIHYELFQIDKNTPKLKIPIKDSYAPNVFVSVVILRGRMHNEKDASGFETGAPGLKIGYLNLKVEPKHKKLDVAAKPAKETAIPGEEVTIDLDVKDNNKNPVKGQVTLMVVDEAVLGLTAYKTPKPLAQLYAEHLLGIRTGSNLLDLPHAKRSRLEKIFPGGGMDDGDMQTKFPAELRKLFESTAYYNPNVLLDENGKASVSFKLPDNLTTFRVMAVAVDKGLRVGSNDAQIQVKQPLMVQPVMPRFVYPDDILQVEALIYNGTNKDGKIKLQAEFEGLELTSGELTNSIDLKPNSTGTIAFPVKVLKDKEVTIRYAVSNGNYNDAVEVKIPILEPGTKRTIIENKRVSDKDKIKVTLPENTIKGSAQMEIVLSTTNLSELKDAVQYLMRYPNGCIEQTTSTAYPLVVLKDLLPEIGVEVNMDELKKFSEAGVRRILSFQTTEGGLAYWPGSDNAHAFATAFGLTALIEAKQKGYDVPDNALRGMADYLERSLREGKITEEMPHGGMADADTRALFVMTLGRLGRPQPGYISVLWEKRDQLTPFGLSFLAIAVKENPGNKSLLQPILAEIKKSANQDTEEAWYGGNPSGGWSFDSPLRTHAGALLAYASTASNDAMTGKYLKGLLSRRKYGMWGNTQENVFGIMGVYESANQKAGGNAPSMLLKVNDKAYNNTQMEQNSSQIRRLKLVEDDLNMTEGKASEQVIQLTNKGGMPIIFTVRTHYDEPLTEENMKAEENGFLIQRKYETMKGKSLEGKDIPLGSLVKVRVFVRTDQSHHYVAIDDKLPAGLEPLNTSLSTTENINQGTLTNLMQKSLSVLSYSEIRDSRVAFYVDEMIPGEYEYTYVARATTPGTYLRPAGRVEAMYQPEVNGLTATDYVTITE